jgi:hypothetical protein
MAESAATPAVLETRRRLLACLTHSFNRTGGKTAAFVPIVFMALLSFRGINIPSRPAQGEQRRSSFTSDGTLPINGIDVGRESEQPLGLKIQRSAESRLKSKSNSNSRGDF